MKITFSLLSPRLLRAPTITRPSVVQIAGQRDPLALVDKSAANLRPSGDCVCGAPFDDLASFCSLTMRGSVPNFLRMQITKVN